MRILFLVPYPTGESPSQRFRFEQYFDLLSKNEIAYRVSSFWGMRGWAILYQKGMIIEKTGWLIVGFLKRFVDLIRSTRYDLIFVHRECAPVGPPVFEYILAKIFKKKIIYDFDDAIWLENTSRENHFARWIKFHGKVKYICRWSHAVSCGNEWLANYARQYNSNAVVNPTTINTEDLHNPERWPPVKKNDRIVIGWTGTHSTVDYLNEIFPTLESIQKKFPVTIRIISNKKPSINLTSVDFIPWNKATEIPDLLTFDIGVMPLTDNDWARGKCGFKALQYMALGIPCIASPVGINPVIIDQGINGFLCSKPEEWEQTLEKLILDSPLRKKIGLAGRQKVVGHYSVSSNSSDFLLLTRL